MSRMRRGGPLRIRGDLLDLAVSGVATRLGMIVGADARAAVAANAIATGVAFSVTRFVTTSWAPLAEANHLGVGVRTFGPFLDLGPILAGLWLLAAVGAFLRRPALTRSASAAIVLAVAAMEVVRVLHYTSGSISRFSLLFSAALALVSLSGTPRARPRLALSLAGWFPAFAVIDAANGVVLLQSSLYLCALGPANAAGLTMALTAACLVAAGLANVNQQQSAMVVLISSTPWLLMWAVEFATDLDGSFTFPFPLCSGALLLGCYGISAALLRHAMRRNARRT